MTSPNSTPATASKVIFPFLSLPPELRNLVYQELLIGGSDAGATRQAQILRTCKQVNQEATAMLYGENVVQMVISSRDVLVSKLPLTSTGCPLHRIEKLAIHMRVVFSFWDYEDKDPKKVRENVWWLCRRRLATQHAIKDLTLRITWAAFPDFSSSYDDPEVEEKILSEFSMLRNIPNVSIEASTSEAFNQSLKDVMQSHEEQEDTV